MVRPFCGNRTRIVSPTRPACSAFTCITMLEFSEWSQICANPPAATATGRFRNWSDTPALLAIAALSETLVSPFGPTKRRNFAPPEICAVLCEISLDLLVFAAIRPSTANSTPAPEFVIKRIAAVHATYFQGVPIEVQLQGHRKAVVRYSGFEKQHRIMGFAIIGFFKKALEISGAKDVVLRFTVPIEEGKAFSELSISWS